MIAKSGIELSVTFDFLKLLQCLYCDTFAFTCNNNNNNNNNMNDNVYGTIMAHSLRELASTLDECEIALSDN